MKEILPQNIGKYPYSKKDNPGAKKTMDKNPFLNEMVYPSYHDFIPIGEDYPPVIQPKANKYLGKSLVRAPQKERNEAREIFNLEQNIKNMKIEPPKPKASGSDLINKLWF